MKEILYGWKRENGLNQPEFYNLVECFRRLNQFNKDLDDNLMLLATPSEVKQAKQLDILIASFHETPRTTNWYKLTEKGQQLISKLCKKCNFVWTDELNLQLYEGF